MAIFSGGGHLSDHPASSARVFIQYMYTLYTAVDTTSRRVDLLTVLVHSDRSVAELTRFVAIVSRQLTL